MVMVIPSGRRVSSRFIGVEEISSLASIRGEALPAGISVTSFAMSVVVYGGPSRVARTAGTARCGRGARATAGR